MKNKIMFKYLKCNWKSDDFGRGKSVISKSRIRRTIKKIAKRLFEKDMNKE